MLVEGLVTPPALGFDNEMWTLGVGGAVWALGRAVCTGLSDSIYCFMTLNTDGRAVFEKGTGVWGGEGDLATLETDVGSFSLEGLDSLDSDVGLSGAGDLNETGRVVDELEFEVEGLGVAGGVNGFLLWGSAVPADEGPSSDSKVRFLEAG